ncbi:MAG: hypothetical protein FWB90_04615 [Fibromonadales bacterium]|nr:hypothetical protein [Fibromonadales bacterium]
MKKNIAILLFLFAQFSFANSSFMLGAKTFTLDFKGYSGFMLELGGSTGIPMTNENLFLGILSGFGFASNSYSEQIPGFISDEITIKASSTVLPIKLFFSYGSFGINLGTLLTFWNVKTDGYGLSTDLSNFNDKGTKAYLDFGIMLFPVENFSIGLDVITSGSATGFALGINFRFGKQSNNKENNNYSGYTSEENDCLLKANSILYAYIEEEEDEEYKGDAAKDDSVSEEEKKNIAVCIELKNNKKRCLSLKNKYWFENKSLEVIRDFKKETFFLQWNKLPVAIPYSEFFPNGFCEFEFDKQHNNNNDDCVSEKNAQLIRADSILYAYVGGGENGTNENMSICIVLQNNKKSCLNLSDVFWFKNRSLEDIRDFKIGLTYIEWNQISASIPYTDFFENMRYKCQN